MLGKVPELSEAEVAGHFAGRSRISRSRSNSLLGAGGEVLVGADAFDLGGECVDDESVDAAASNPGDGLVVVGEVVGQPDGGLLAMTSRCQDAPG